MTPVDLPADIEALLARIESALQHPKLEAVLNDTLDSPQDQGSETTHHDEGALLAMQARAEEAEAEVERLRSALESAEQRRKEALGKVTAATDQLDMLLEEKEEI